MVQLMRYEIEDESLLNLPHLQDVLDQLLLVVQGVLEAEEDAGGAADDDDHGDDDEGGNQDQDKQTVVLLSRV